MIRPQPQKSRTVSPQCINQNVSKTQNMDEICNLRQKENFIRNLSAEAQYLSQKRHDSINQNKRHVLDGKNSQQHSIEYLNSNGQLNLNINNTGFTDGNAYNRYSNNQQILLNNQRQYQPREIRREFHVPQNYDTSIQVSRNQNHNYPNNQEILYNRQHDNTKNVYEYHLNPIRAPYSNNFGYSNNQFSPNKIQQNINLRPIGDHLHKINQNQNFNYLQDQKKVSFLDEQNEKQNKKLQDQNSKKLKSLEKSRILKMNENTIFKNSNEYNDVKILKAVKDNMNQQINHGKFNEKSILNDTDQIDQIYNQFKSKLKQSPSSSQKSQKKRIRKDQKRYQREISFQSLGSLNNNGIQGSSPSTQKLDEFIAQKAQNGKGTHTQQNSMNEDILTPQNESDFVANKYLQENAVSTGLQSMANQNQDNFIEFGRSYNHQHNRSRSQNLAQHQPYYTKDGIEPVIIQGNDRSLKSKFLETSLTEKSKSTNKNKSDSYYNYQDASSRRKEEYMSPQNNRIHFQNQNLVQRSPYSQKNLDLGNQYPLEADNQNLMNQNINLYNLSLGTNNQQRHFNASKFHDARNISEQVNQNDDSPNPQPRQLSVEYGSQQQQLTNRYDANLHSINLQNQDSQQQLMHKASSPRFHNNRQDQIYLDQISHSIDKQNREQLQNINHIQAQRQRNLLKTFNSLPSGNNSKEELDNDEFEEESNQNQIQYFDNRNYQYENQPINQNYQDEKQQMSFDDKCGNNSLSIGFGNMNFNTQDLIKFTGQLSQSGSKKMINGDYESGQSNLNQAINEFDEYQLGTIPWHQQNTTGWSSELHNYTLNNIVNPDRAVEMENQSNHYNRYDKNLNNTNYIKQGNDTFRGENFINMPFGQQTKVSTIYSGQMKLGTVNSSEDNETIQAQTGKNISITRSEQQNIQNFNQNISKESIKKKLNDYIFQDFANRIFLKNKLISVHSNLLQLQSQQKQNLNQTFDYKVFNPFMLAQELNLLSQRLLLDEQTNQMKQYNQSRGFSNLSDNDSSLQFSKLQNRQTQKNGLMDGSHSTLQNRFEGSDNDIQQLRQQKEDSEAMINNLRKTIKEMAKQMKLMETKMNSIEDPHETLQYRDQDGIASSLKVGEEIKHEYISRHFQQNGDLQYTPSLSNISPRCKSETYNGRVGPVSFSSLPERIHKNQDSQKILFLESQLQIKDMSKQNLQVELDQKSKELNDLKQENDKIIFQIEEKHRKKENDLQQLIDELKKELDQSIIKSKEYLYDYNQSQSILKNLKLDFQQKSDEYQKLNSELDQVKRHLNMVKNQLKNEQSSYENEKIRLQSTKDQEKHWRCGYETIYQKYSQLKDQQTEREKQVQKMQTENEQRVKILVSKAEGAIKFFKDIAFERQGKAAIEAFKAEKENYQDNITLNRNYQKEPRYQMKFQAGKQIGPQVRSFRVHNQLNSLETINSQPDQSTLSLIHNYLNRSKSANSPSHLNSHEKENIQRQVPLSPNRENEINSRISDLNQNLQKSEPRINFVNKVPSYEKDGYQSRYLKNKQADFQNYRTSKSYSSSKMVTIADSRNQKNKNNLFQNNQSPDSQHNQKNKNSNSLSLNTLRKIAYVERIQKINEQSLQNQNEKNNQEQNIKLILAIEAMEDAFNEISDIKLNINKYCDHHLQKNCSQMQEFQVLSFDYLKLIDERIQIETDLRSQIKKKNIQMQNMKEIAKGNQSVIQHLQNLLNEQQSLKQSQWKNIIDYDTVKDQEQAKAKQTMRQETKIVHKILQQLHQEIDQKQNTIENIEQELQNTINQKVSAENTAYSQKNRIEEMSIELQQNQQQNIQIQQIFKKIQDCVKEIMKGCGIEIHNFEQEKPQVFQNTFINSPSVSFSALHEEKHQNQRELEDAFLNQTGNEPVSFNFTATDSCAISQADINNLQSLFHKQSKQAHKSSFQGDNQAYVSLRNNEFQIQQKDIISKEIILSRDKQKSQSSTRRPKNQEQLKNNIMKIQSTMPHSPIAKKFRSQSQSPKIYVNNQAQKIDDEMNIDQMVEWLDQIYIYIQIQQEKIGQSEKLMIDIENSIKNNTQQNSMSIINNAFSRQADDKNIYHMSTQKQSNQNILIDEQSIQNQGYEQVPINKISNHKSLKVLHAQSLSKTASLEMSSSRLNRTNQLQSQMRQNNQQHNIITITDGDNISQSLDSFINKQNYKIKNSNPQSLIHRKNEVKQMNLDEFSDEQYDHNQNFQTFSPMNKGQLKIQIPQEQNQMEDQIKQYQEYNQKPHIHQTLVNQIQNLFNELNQKNLMINDLNDRVLKLSDKLVQEKNEMSNEMNNLTVELKKAQRDFEQLTHVYKQENQMRQDLEIDLETQKQHQAMHQDQIKKMTIEISNFEKQLQQTQDDKNKIEQSLDYWESSYKLVEKHFLQEKEKSDSQIGKLNNQRNQLIDENQNLQDQLQKVTENLDELQYLWNNYVETRQKCENEQTQTNLTADEIQNLQDVNGKLVRDVEQVNKDIQILINSYDNFKEENINIQVELKNKIQEIQSLADEQFKNIDLEKQLIINRLNQEIQDEIKARQKCQQEIFDANKIIQDQTDKINILEAQKEEIEMQAIQQKQQYDELYNLNELVQHFNQQVQMQNQNMMVNHHSQATCNEKSSLDLQKFCQTDQSNNQLLNSYSISRFARNLQNSNNEFVAGGSYLGSQGTQNDLAQSINSKNIRNILNNETSQSFIDDLNLQQSLQTEQNRKIENQIMQDVKLNDDIQNKAQIQRCSQFSFVNRLNSQESRQQQHVQFQEKEQKTNPLQNENLQQLNQNDYEQEVSYLDNNDKNNENHVISFADELSQNNLRLMHGSCQNNDSSYKDQQIVHNIKSGELCIEQMNMSGIVDSHQQIRMRNKMINTMNMPHELRSDSLTMNIGRTLNSSQPYQNDNHNQHTINYLNTSIPGLDICQQCINFESQIQTYSLMTSNLNQQNQVLIKNYIQMGKVLSEICLDNGQSILKNQDLVLQKQQKREVYGESQDVESFDENEDSQTNNRKIILIDSKNTNELHFQNHAQIQLNSKSSKNKISSFSNDKLMDNNENNNFEVITPEKRNNMIKKAFKFLNNNDFSKFIIQSNQNELQETNNENIKRYENLNRKVNQRLDKLFKYSQDMLQIAQIMIKIECEKQNATSKSKETLAVGTVRRDIQSDFRNKYALSYSTSLGINDYQLSNTNHKDQNLVHKYSNKSCQANIQIQSSEMKQEIDFSILTQQIDLLGTSLDKKIDTLLKLLVTLKQLKQQSKKSDGVIVQLIDQLVSTLSKIVHEMTEDTRLLGEIKSKVDDVNSQDHSSSIKKSISSKTKTFSNIDLPLIIDENSRLDSTKNFSKINQFQLTDDQDQFQRLRQTEQTVNIQYLDEDGKSLNDFTQNTDLSGNSNNINVKGQFENFIRHNYNHQQNNQRNNQRNTWEQLQQKHDIKSTLSKKRFEQFGLKEREYQQNQMLQQEREERHLKREALTTIQQEQSGDPTQSKESFAFKENSNIKQEPKSSVISNQEQNMTSSLETDNEEYHVLQERKLSSHMRSSQQQRSLADQKSRLHKQEYYSQVDKSFDKQQRDINHDLFVASSKNNINEFQLGNTLEILNQNQNHEQQYQDINMRANTSQSPRSFLNSTSQKAILNQNLKNQNDVSRMLNESSSKSIFNNRKVIYSQNQNDVNQQYYQKLSTKDKILFAQSQVLALKEQLLINQEFNDYNLKENHQPIQYNQNQSPIIQPYDQSQSNQFKNNQYQSNQQQKYVKKNRSKENPPQIQRQENKKIEFQNMMKEEQSEFQPQFGVQNMQDKKNVPILGNTTEKMLKTQSDNQNKSYQSEKFLMSMQNNKQMQTIQSSYGNSMHSYQYAQSQKQYPIASEINNSISQQKQDSQIIYGQMQITPSSSYDQQTHLSANSNRQDLKLEQQRYFENLKNDNLKQSLPSDQSGEYQLRQMKSQIISSSNSVHSIPNDQYMINMKGSQYKMSPVDQNQIISVINSLTQVSPKNGNILRIQSFVPVSHPQSTTHSQSFFSGGRLAKDIMPTAGFPSSESLKKNEVQLKQNQLNNRAKSFQNNIVPQNPLSKQIRQRNQQKSSMIQQINMNDELYKQRNSSLSKKKNTHSSYENIQRIQYSKRPEVQTMMPTQFYNHKQEKQESISSYQSKDSKISSKNKKRQLSKEYKSLRSPIQEQEEDKIQSPSKQKQVQQWINQNFDGR